MPASKDEDNGHHLRALLRRVGGEFGTRATETGENRHRGQLHRPPGGPLNALLDLEAPRGEKFASSSTK